MKLAYGAAETRNVRYRHAMEDKYKCVLDFMRPGDGYFAVFDGHHDATAAEWCATRFHQHLEHNIKRRGGHWQPPAILAGTFDEADALVGRLDSGCAAAVAYLKTSRRLGGDSSTTLYTANVGDTRIVLCTDGGVAERLTKDHTTSNERERQRVVQNGGMVINNRVDGVLAVTRALGDAELKGYVCGKPYTMELEIDYQRDEFFISASDGLWQVCDDQTAVDLVRFEQDPKVAAKALVRYAIKKGSTDNITCVVVRLQRPPSEVLPALKPAVVKPPARLVTEGGGGATMSSSASYCGTPQAMLKSIQTPSMVATSVSR